MLVSASPNREFEPHRDLRRLLTLRGLEQCDERVSTHRKCRSGTGQGLALARKVVCDVHGGELTFETEMGRGTTFHVRLSRRPRTPRDKRREHDDDSRSRVVLLASRRLRNEHSAASIGQRLSLCFVQLDAFSLEVELGQVRAA